MKVSRAPEPWRLKDDALEDLGPAAVALDHLEVDAHAIPGSKDGRPFLTWARSMLSMTLLIGVLLR